MGGDMEPGLGAIEYVSDRRSSLLTFSSVTQTMNALAPGVMVDTLGVVNRDREAKYPAWLGDS